MSRLNTKGGDDNHKPIDVDIQILTFEDDINPHHSSEDE